jgi:hypothetical protein
LVWANIKDAQQIKELKNTEIPRFVPTKTFLSH